MVLPDVSKDKHPSHPSAWVQEKKKKNRQKNKTRQKKKFKRHSRVPLA